MQYLRPLFCFQRANETRLCDNKILARLGRTKYCNVTDKFNKSYTVGRILYQKSQRDVFISSLATVCIAKYHRRVSNGCSVNYLTTSEICVDRYMFIAAELFSLVIRLLHLSVKHAAILILVLPFLL